MKRTFLLLFLSFILLNACSPIQYFKDPLLEEHLDEAITAVEALNE